MKMDRSDGVEAVVVRPIASGRDTTIDRYASLARLVTDAGVPTRLVDVSEDFVGRFVLIDRADHEMLRGRNDVAMNARTMLLNVDRSNVFELLERDRLAGAVTSDRLAQWRRDPEHDGHSGICGLRQVGFALDWPMSDGPVFASTNYSYLYDPDAGGLHHEIAHYVLTLASLDRVSQDPSQ